MASLSFRLFLQKQNISVAGSIIGGVVNAIVIIAFNVIWRKAADILTAWENHRTQTEYDDALTFKIFLFQFVNSYISLYYIAFFKSHNSFWGVNYLEDKCKIGSREYGVVGWGCTTELTVQVATLLGTNMFIGQTKEVAVPFIMSKLQLYLLKRKAAKEAEEGAEVKPLPAWEMDGKLSAYQGTFDEYSEMVIQFGYCTLFAAAFPLAPLLAVLNNVVEIRTDAFKLLDSTVRPHYRGAQDIGSWYHILEVLGILSVITNCLLIGFSFKAVADLFNGSSIDNRKFQIFAVAVIIEHAMLFLKYVIAELIPDVPGWVRRETARSEYMKEQTFKKFTLKNIQKKTYD